MAPHFLTSAGGKLRLLFIGCLILSGFASYQFASWAAQLVFAQPNLSLKHKATPVTLLIPSQGKLDLGTIAKGGSRRSTIWLQNRSNDVVEVWSVSTSCDCFQFALHRTTILPGEKVTACATVDLASQPDFTGGLCLEAEGTAKDQELAAFVVKATIRVVEQGTSPNE